MNELMRWFWWHLSRLRWRDIGMSVLYIAPLLAMLWLVVWAASLPAPPYSDSACARLEISISAFDACLANGRCGYDKRDLEHYYADKHLLKTHCSQGERP